MCCVVIVLSLHQCQFIATGFQLARYSLLWDCFISNTVAPDPPGKSFWSFSKSAICTSDLYVIIFVQMANKYICNICLPHKPATWCSVEFKTKCQVDKLYTIVLNKFSHLLCLQPWLDMVDPSCVHSAWEEGRCWLQRRTNIYEYIIASDYMYSTDFSNHNE